MVLNKRKTAHLVCDAEVSLDTNKWFFGKHSGNEFTAKLKKENVLTVPKELSKCIIKTSSLTINLLKDEYRYPFLVKYNHYNNQCTYRNHKKTLKDKIFFSDNRQMFSCIDSSNKIEILDDAKESFLIKLETLLNIKLSNDFITDQNPYASLDFSNSPKFDAIFLSTLLYKSDFTGTVFSRVLKHHADKGTLIYILGTEYMHNDKDKALLSELTNYSPNIRVQEYDYVDDGFTIRPKTMLSNKFRNIHMKALVTISESNPKNNSVIIGGRNIHDGFLFDTRPDFSKFPKLNNFDKDESYAYWRDLEIKIQSAGFARKVFSHLLSFWNRESETQTPSFHTDRSSMNSNKNDHIDFNNGPLLRHFISIPFEDDMALEKLYVDMIDSASKSIKLSTPYLRPSKAIMKALVRAAQRNVDIIIQTRINLEGDTQAWLYEETNKAAINSLYKKMKVYEWQDESILHTKMIIIDNNFSFFGSVNLSQRSFLHDIEHGVLIRDTEFVEKLINIFTSYNRKSKLITEKQKRKLFASLIIAIVPDLF